MVRAIFGLLLLVGLASGASAQSGPADSMYGTPAERDGPFFATLPKCDDAGVLSTISGRSAQTENSPLGRRARDRRILRACASFRANGLAYIPRRVARALMDDPRAPTDDRMRKRTTVYSIADAGIIGWGYGVEWCVVGLDREHALCAGLLCSQADHRAMDRAIQMARRLWPQGPLLRRRHKRISVMILRDPWRAIIGALALVGLASAASAQSSPPAATARCSTFM